MPRVPHTADLLACAAKAARTGAAHAAAQRHRRGETLLTAPHDVKLRLDVECQQRVTRVLRAAFPDHAILAEEDARHTRRAPPGCQWVVDPIDGTVNFFHGLPNWCCSVAVRRGRTTLAAAICAPDNRELFLAARGGGATLNGKPLRVSTAARLSGAMVMTGCDRLEEFGIAPMTYLRRAADSARKVRLMGSAALDMCRVATGQADAYFEAGIYLWDVAAAALIVERAGGRVEMGMLPGTAPRLWCLATNARLHREIRAALSPLPGGSQATGR